MPLDSSEKLLHELDRKMLPHEHSLLSQLTTDPIIAVRFRLLLRLSGLLWRSGRERTVTIRNVAGQQMKVPLAACWDLVAFGMYLDEPERRLLKFMINTLRPGDCMIDAGANVGFFSCIAADRVGPTGRVIAFEPDETSLGYLKENVKPFSQVELVEAALSSENGEIAFFRGVGNAMVSSSTVEQHLYENGIGEKPYEVTVQSLRLDSFCAERNLQPNLIKVDVEGGEPAFLDGAETLLETQSPDVVMEIDYGHFEEIESSSVSQLKKMGYAPYLITSDGTLRPAGTDGLRNRGEALVQSRGYLHNVDNVVFRKSETAEGPGT